MKEYYSRNQDYYASNGESLFEDMAMIGTLDFITDGGEVIEE